MKTSHWSLRPCRKCEISNFRGLKISCWICLHPILNLGQYCIIIRNILIGSWESYRINGLLFRSSEWSKCLHQIIGLCFSLVLTQWDPIKIKKPTVSLKKEPNSHSQAVKYKTPLNWTSYSGFYCQTIAHVLFINKFSLNLIITFFTTI